MKGFLFCTALLGAFNSFAGEWDLMAPSWVQYQRPDSTLAQNETKLIIEVQSPKLLRGGLHVQYGLNDLTGTMILDSLNTASLCTEPGKYRMDFLLSTDFEEISIDSTLLQGGYVTKINLSFYRSSHYYEVRKPVIYLYPEKEQDVRLEVAPKGEFIFTHPEYKNGWEVTAHPNGNLTHNGEDLSYLFWESNQRIMADQLPKNEGFVLTSAEVLPFLEKTLNAYGFTSKERADFITYWAPVLIKHPNLYICFKFNEACDDFADLNISPEPDVLARFYMLWTPIDSASDVTYIQPQTIPKIERNGFVVFEWGGLQVEPNVLIDL